MATKIWIVQTSFMGDCVLTLPLIARCFELVPDAEVHVIAGNAGAALFAVARDRGLGHVASRFFVHRYDKRGEHRGWRAGASFVAHLKRAYGVPAIVLCVQRSFRTGLLAVASRASVRIGFSSGAASYLYTRVVKRDWESGRSEVEKNLDLLRAWLGEARVAPWDPVRAPSLLARPGAAPAPAVRDAPVLVALGSPWPTKRWPVENAVQLIEPLVRQGQSVVLIGERDAVPLAEAVQQHVPSLLLQNLCGRTSVEEWVDLVARGRVLVSGDSAAVHVASDLGVPVLALFGPTVPEFGFAPWRKGSLALGVKDLPCRPCDIHGPLVCPLGHHKCLRDLPADRVLRFLARFLEDFQIPQNS